LWQEEGSRGDGLRPKATRQVAPLKNRWSAPAVAAAVRGVEVLAGVGAAVAERSEVVGGERVAGPGRIATDPTAVFFGEYLTTEALVGGGVAARCERSRDD
jgi:hypothetical protein